MSVLPFFMAVGLGLIGAGVEGLVGAGVGVMVGAYLGVLFDVAAGE